MSSNANYRPTPGAALPVLQLITGTAETQILSAVTSPTQLPLAVDIPANSILEQQEWSGNASGYIVAGAATGTVTAKLYAGKSATIGSNTLLATSGAVAQVSSTAPFIISIEKAIFDTVSGKLSGVAEILLNNTLVARAAFSNIVTGLNKANNPILSLSLTFTFSVAAATTAVSIANFEVAF